MRAYIEICFTLQPTPAGAACEVYSQLSNPWPTGTGTFSNSVNLYVKNTGTAEIPIPYTVNVTAPGYINTQYSW